MINHQDTMMLARHTKATRSMVSFVPLWFNYFLWDKSLALGLFFTTEAQRTQRKSIYCRLITLMPCVIRLSATAATSLGVASGI